MTATLPASPPAYAPALAVRDVRFRHTSRDRPFTLDVPSFEVAAGESVLLTGPSGSGKSTLLFLLAGLLDPEAGTVEVAGSDMHALKGAARDRFRGRHLGMVFQTFHLALGFTALENVMMAILFGAPPKDRVPETPKARAEALLAALEIDRPGALVETLSIGQQQRVAVARALACRPAIVLADEPTASLDAANASRAVDLLRSTCNAEKAALLVVSHDHGLRPSFDRSVDLLAIARPANGVTEGAPR
jgi:putative ABC transport system ATP-binding protein